MAQLTPAAHRATPGLKETTYTKRYTADAQRSGRQSKCFDQHGIWFSLPLRFSKRAEVKSTSDFWVVEKSLTYSGHQSGAREHAFLHWSARRLHHRTGTGTSPPLRESHQEQRLCRRIQKHHFLAAKGIFKMFQSRCFQTDFGNGNSSKELSEKNHKS